MRFMEKSVHIDDYMIRDTKEEFKDPIVRAFHKTQEQYDKFTLEYLEINKRHNLLDYVVLD